MNKPVSTAQTPANIDKITALLAEAPLRLERLTAGLTAGQLLVAPSGERPLHAILAHLPNSEARTSEAIYLALLVDEPLLANLHPEREWGKLECFDRLPFTDLLAYFRLRRRVLLGVLAALDEPAWARSLREPGKQRHETVYWKARALAMHEVEHLDEIERRLMGSNLTN